MILSIVDNLKQVIGSFMSLEVRGMTVNEAMEAECFGRGGGRHAVFIDGTDRKFVTVSTHVKLFAPYSGRNCVNADDLEKRVHEKLHNTYVLNLWNGPC